MTILTNLASKTPARYNRRQLLATTAAAVVSAGPVTSLWAHQVDAQPAWKMKLSTSSLHYRSLSVEEACRRIGKLGFEGIDVWAHFEWAGPLCEHLEGGLERLGPEKFAALLQTNGLKLFSASCYSAPFSRFATLLGQLGGGVVVRGSGPLAAAASGEVTAKELTRQMHQFLESLKPELELAAANHCVLAIENHSGTALLNKLDSIKIFTDLNRNERLGIALAPYHVQLNAESVEEAIRACGSQLKFFYAWQHGEATQQLPGIGPTDMRPWLRALADVNYQGYVNPFMHHEPEPAEMDQALGTSRDYLLKLYQGVIKS